MAEISLGNPYFDRLSTIQHALDLAEKLKEVMDLVTVDSSASPDAEERRYALSACADTESVRRFLEDEREAVEALAVIHEK